MWDPFYCYSVYSIHSIHSTLFYGDFFLLVSDTPHIFQFSSVLGRSPGEGKDYPLQYSGLENSMDCIAHGAAKSRTWLSDFQSLTHSVQSLSHVWLFATPQTAACQASLSITYSQSLLNSCPSSQWCHATISSAVIPFFCLQSFSASGSFPVSWLFTSGGQSIGTFASASVLPMNIQGWFLCSPRDSEESSWTPQFKRFKKYFFIWLCWVLVAACGI